MGKNLQAALERGRGGAAASASPLPVAAVVQPPQPAKAPSRVGKKHVGAYLNADFQKSILLVRAQTGKDVQTILAEALNDLFRAHNVPVVDYE